MSSKLVKAIAGSLLVFIIAFTGLTYNSNDYDSSAIVSNYKKTLAPSRTNTVQTLSEAISNSESKVDSTPDMNSASGHNHVHWKQGNYGNAIYSTSVKTTTIAGGGCGWCSLTCLMAYLCPTECAAKEPPEWLDIMGDDVRRYWSGGSMSWDAPQVWIDKINSLGNYGQYEMIESFEGSANRTPDILKIIKKYAGDPNTAVVLSTSTGLFTNHGHIILAVDITEDGEHFHICNSSGVAADKMGISWDASNTYDYSFNETSINGYSYYMKCAWVIRRKS